jgi:hypothetical protein
MNLKSDNLAELGSLKITIVEKQADGTCRVHTYASADGVPEVTTTTFAAAMAGYEDYERLEDDDDDDEDGDEAETAGLVALSS